MSSPEPGPERAHSAHPMEAVFAHTEAKDREIHQVTYDFTGDVVFITGGARGQGRSHALGFARAGANVVLVDTQGKLASVYYGLATNEDLDQTAADCRALGVEALAVTADVRDSAQVEAAANEAIERFGKIDVLICYAGVASLFEVSEMPEEAWDELIDINLKGVFLAAKHVSRHMIAAKSGKIIFTGSIHCFTGVPAAAHYVAAKHGVSGFAKALALELAPSGITVNYVCPTAVNTTMVEAMLDPRVPENFGERMVGLTGSWNQLQEGAPPLEPIEITQAMLWLASDSADFVTGAPLLVDAGFTAK
jgi:NAD(P)-dependent dehydrogenase (short-subunit alcohol dehydrogenase family)